MTQSTVVQPFTDLVLEVFRLNGRLLAAGDALCTPLGLTSARWQVLGAIDDGPLPVSAIARGMGLTRQSVQRTVDVLAREGLVETLPNPEHKRAYLVALTEPGRDRLDDVTRLQERWAAEVADGLDPADLAATTRLLTVLRDRLDGATDQGDTP